MPEPQHSHWIETLELILLTGAVTAGVLHFNNSFAERSVQTPKPKTAHSEYQHHLPNNNEINQYNHK